MNETMIQQGWQCPICKRVYSPFTIMCYYCGADTVTTTNTGTGTVYPQGVKITSYNDSSYIVADRKGE